MKVFRLCKTYRKLFPLVEAITIAPFGIFKRDKTMKYNTLNHELIHWKQQTELLIIPFYILYAIEWSIKIFSGPAYYRISFEKEAYLNEQNGKYLNTRKPFAWIKYLK